MYIGRASCDQSTERFVTGKWLDGVPVKDEMKSKEGGHSQHEV